MNILQRKLLMGFLVASFAVQTALVYTDDTADAFDSLSPLAQRGRAIYHQHNCYTCHQIYGFGGFLGPDLTNVTRRVDRERFDQILTDGSDKLQMPAYHFSKEKIDALVAYLENVDATGIGQAVQSPPPPTTAIEAAIRATAEGQAMSETEARGFQLFRTGACVACHRVLFHNTLGMLTAPDLSTATSRWSDSELDQTLKQGRNAMPASGLPDGDRGALIAWMHWLSTHRVSIHANLGATGERPIPWWEFGTIESEQAPVTGDSPR